MKTIKHTLITSFAVFLASHVTHAQELGSVASNFDTKVWARPTDFPVNPHFPFNFGQLPVACSFSHLKYDDPIQKPGQISKAPLHVFFGNNSANANSTYPSLRANGEGTCFGGPLNRSAYFIPSVMNGLGQVVLPDFIDVFYVGDYRTRTFPRGLRMIFGFDETNPAESWDILNPKWSWSVSANGGMMGPANWGTNFRYPTLNPQVWPSWFWNNASYGIAMRLRSPRCWDGVNLDSSNHRSHLSYFVNGNCPATHPVHIPEVTITSYYKFLNLGDAQTWYLSSDRFGGKSYSPGTNVYAGFIPAWDDAIMQTWTTNILNKANYGSLGKLGDGRILDKPSTSKLYGPTSFKPYFLWSLQTTPYMGAPQGYANNNLINPPAP